MRKTLTAALLIAAAFVALAFNLQTFDVPTPQPGTTNAIGGLIDLRAARVFAVQISATSTNGGSLTMLASNSLDAAAWTFDAANTFALPYGAGTVSLLTNLTAGATGYETYGIGSPSTNSYLSAFVFRVAGKP